MLWQPADGNFIKLSKAVLQVAQDVQKEKCDDLAAKGLTSSVAFLLNCNPANSANYAAGNAPPGANSQLA